jgi:hypothetical protein
MLVASKISLTVSNTWLSREIIMHSFADISIYSAFTELWQQEA